jgi:threonine dehydrogenase-like Zn-dependent dehydrogenase
VKELITQRFSLEKAAEAFKTAMNSVESLKVMILNK